MVHVLHHKPVQRRVGYDRRHFHQLFCRLLREAHGACYDGMEMRPWALRWPARAREYRAAGTPPPVGSPSAAQEHQATAR